jgi:hypothetical protein
VKVTDERRFKMATLTLKKAKTIGDTPLENIQSKFVVMRQSRTYKSFRFSAYHETFNGAMREAKRLTKANPTERFLVLQVQGGSDWGV